MIDFGWRAGVVITGDAMHFRRFGTEEVVSLPNFHEIPPPAMPPARLPEAVQVGLATRRHLEAASRKVPIFRRGVVDSIETAEEVLTEGLRSIRPGGLRSLIKPTVVAAGRWGNSDAFKRVGLDMLERAGARVVYLVDYPMACAMGSGADVTGDSVTGVLALERDWYEYAVISYADYLVSANDGLGVSDLAKGEVCEAGALEMIVQLIESAHEDLTDAQHTRLQQDGIVLCGAGAEVDMLPERLSDMLGLSVRGFCGPHHPAVLGIDIYLKHLPEWRQTMTSI